MKALPAYPSLYQINTRVWLTELSRKLGRAALLDDIPEAELDRMAETGFDWIWFLSVWQTGLGAQRISRSNAEWRHEFQQTLPDLREEDIAGSGFLQFNVSAARARTDRAVEFAPTHIARAGLGANLAGQSAQLHVSGTAFQLDSPFDSVDIVVSRAAPGMQRRFRRNRDFVIDGDVLHIHVIDAHAVA